MRTLFIVITWSPPQKKKESTFHIRNLLSGENQSENQSKSQSEFPKENCKNCCFSLRGTIGPGGALNGHLLPSTNWRVDKFNKLIKRIRYCFSENLGDDPSYTMTIELNLFQPVCISIGDSIADSIIELWDSIRDFRTGLF